MKKPDHGVPNQMDSQAIWSKYTSEAAKLKVEDLEARIRLVEKELQDHPIPASQVVSPREFQSDFTSEKEMSSVYGGTRIKLLLGEVRSPRDKPRRALTKPKTAHGGRYKKSALVETSDSPAGASE